MLQVLCFYTHKVRVCMDLQNVVKIENLMTTEFVPGSPSYLVGLMNIADKGVPLIDLGMRLGMTRSDLYTLDTPVILCSDGEREIGMVVDKITGLASIEKNLLKTYDEFNKPDSPFVASAILEGELYLLLDISHILTVDTIAEIIQPVIKKAMMD